MNDILEAFTRRQERANNRLSLANNNARWFASLAVAEMAVVVPTTQSFLGPEWKAYILGVTIFILGFSIVCFVYTVYLCGKIQQMLENATGELEVKILNSHLSKEDCDLLYSKLEKSYSNTNWDPENFNLVGLVLLLIGSVAAGLGLVFLSE